MPDGITISLNTQQFKSSLEKLLPQIQAKASKFLTTHAENMVTEAKSKITAVDEGTLRREISATKDKPLEKHIVANTPYAAFIEFGTGKFAAAEVAKLPNDWQAYAAQFKGQSGGGSFMEMVRRIAEWIGRKSLYADTAIHGTHSEKTGRRKGNKVKNQSADLALAYVIARSILINGIKAQPYMYPAYKKTLQEMIKDLPNLLK